MAMDPGTRYRSAEEYIAALEKRQNLETAPIAALFMLGSEDMLSLKHGGHPWLTRVRCELPTRPLGPSGEEEPVRATYIGGLEADEEKEDAKYAKFVEGMESIDVRKVCKLNVFRPSARSLAHLEESDIIVIGDGDNIERWWPIFHDGPDTVMDRVKWRYYLGAVVLGIGFGAMVLGLKWWRGDAAELLAATKEFEESESKDFDHSRLHAAERGWVSVKAMEVVPVCVNTNYDEAASVVQKLGSGFNVYTLPRSGGLVFNTDGTFEPCNSFLTEHKWDWKQLVAKMSMIAPPDEKANVLACAAFLEKQKEKRRARRVELGLPADAPLPEDSDDEAAESDEEQEEEERLAARKRRELKYRWEKPEVKAREKAEKLREAGAELFREGNFDEALDRFEQACKTDQTDVKSELNRAATLMKLERPRDSVLAADRALWKSEGGEAKAWYRRGAAWLSCGEFNEAIADMDAAKRLAPGDKAIGAIRKKAEEEREDATWTFQADSKLYEASTQEEIEGAAPPKRAPSGSLAAVRTMLTLEEFKGQEVELHDGVLRLVWQPTRDDRRQRERCVRPALLDQRALFCLEELTKRSSFTSLSMRGCCLGAWGAAFVARGARIQGAGLEHLALVDCRLRAEGAASISSLLSRGSKLIELDLSGNGIGDDGLHRLAAELKSNEYLETLKLSRNRIGNARLPTLSACIGKHPALRVLDLSGNHISFPGICHLAQGLKDSTSLAKVYLAYNKLRADSLYRVANVAIGHASLSVVDFRGVRLRKSDRARIEARTKYTRLIFKIDLPKPSEAGELAFDPRDNALPTAELEAKAAALDIEIKQAASDQWHEMRGLEPQKLAPAKKKAAAPPTAADPDAQAAAEAEAGAEAEAETSTGGAVSEGAEGAADEAGGEAAGQGARGEAEEADGEAEEAVGESEDEDPLMEEIPCDDAEAGAAREKRGGEGEELDEFDEVDEEEMEAEVEAIGGDWVYGLAKLGLF